VVILLRANVELDSKENQKKAGEDLLSLYYMEISIKKNHRILLTLQESKSKNE
jgi:hypothetical protein